MGRWRSRAGLMILTAIEVILFSGVSDPAASETAIDYTETALIGSHTSDYPI